MTTRFSLLGAGLIALGGATLAVAQIPGGGSVPTPGASSAVQATTDAAKAKANAGAQVQAPTNPGVNAPKAPSPGNPGNVAPPETPRPLPAPAQPGSRNDANPLPTDRDPDARLNTQPTNDAGAGAKVNVDANAQQDRANNRTTGNAQADAQAAVAGNLSAETQTRVASALGIQWSRGANALTLDTVAPNSVFAQAGLLPGDRIVSIRGQAITTPAAFTQYIYGVPVGQRVPIAVLRDGAEQTFYWTPAQGFVQTLPPLGGAVVAGGPLTATLTYVPGRRIGLTMDSRFQDRTIVTDVAPGSPAEQAGVQIGDQITALNDQPIAGPTDFINRLQQIPVDGQVHLSLARQADRPPFTAERQVITPQPVLPAPVVAPPVIGRDGVPGRGIPGDPRGPIRRAVRP